MSRDVNPVHFDGEFAADIKRVNETADYARIELMNGVAREVLSQGGYCDDKTFATAFFGGIDANMNWGNSFENERIAAPDLPEEFGKALKLARTVCYSCYEPFVAVRSGAMDRTQDIGIVMPGVEEYDGQNVGFKIWQPLGYHPDKNIIKGEIVFKGFSGLRWNKPYDQHVLMRVNRDIAEVSATCVPEYTELDFGVAACRQYLASSHFLGEPHTTPPDLEKRVKQLHEDAAAYLLASE